MLSNVLLQIICRSGDWEHVDGFYPAGDKSRRPLSFSVIQNFKPVSWNDGDDECEIPFEVIAFTLYIWLA